MWEFVFRDDKDKDLGDRMGLDEAVLRGISQLEEFSRRRLIVEAALGGPHYLVRTDVTRKNTIFVVVDDREIGKIVAKCYWETTHYPDWFFGMNMPGGCIPSDTRYEVTVSSQGAFVIIVGPTENSEDDIDTWFTSMENAVPSAKLLRCRLGEVEVSPIGIMVAWVQKLSGACPTKYRIDKFDRIQNLLKILVPLISIIVGLS